VHVKIAAGHFKSGGTFWSNDLIFLTLSPCT